MAQSTSNGGDKPVQEFRIGLVSAAIWMHDGEGGRPFASVRFKKSYRDEGGDWKDTTSFNHDDLPNLSKLAHRAEDWIAQQ